MGYRAIDRVFDRTSDYAGIQVGTSDARAFRLADILRPRAMIGQVSGVLGPLIGRLKCFFECSGNEREALASGYIICDLG